ncbi:MAG TPA: oligosaccharide flippase family protein [Chthoniobacterales bacterium]|jgi:O-antigen/teichoic acid export membrane protein|nr:oligosaccharide flippase family protein [Chthoniobacterales bacterium]
MTTADTMLRPITPPGGVVHRVDPSPELKRGAWTNFIAMLASNFRGVFTFLVARLLGPAALGVFSVAWATTDLISKIGIFGLDDTIITFIARAEAAGDRARSRALARLAVTLGVFQCTLLAGIAIGLVRLFGVRLGLAPEMADALSVMFCAMPVVALYRISTAISRGMKVMRHDIFSRGMTETIVTTVAFLAALWLGWKTFGPEVAVIAGMGASGIVALSLAMSLFRKSPSGQGPFRFGAESRRLLTYAAPISAYDLLNSIIVRLDVVMLGCFVGRAPGVTLTTLGIYGACVEVAGGLRKVNQAFNPIFAPVVAGLTADGDQEHAALAFSRVSQWMLWILLPLVAVMTLAGSFILGIYGPVFQQGGLWLGIVALACATNAFVSLAETVIMVQKPRLNLLNSIITCAVALTANLWLISRFGVTGAAFGILLPYVLQGILRYRALRMVFRWQNPWGDVGKPLLAAIIAGIPAIICRSMIDGMTGEIVSASVFLLIYGVGWLHHRRRQISV